MTHEKNDVITSETNNEMTYIQRLLKLKILVSRKIYSIQKNV